MGFPQPPPELDIFTLPLAFTYLETILEVASLLILFCDPPQPPFILLFLEALFLLDNCFLLFLEVLLVFLLFEFFF